MIRNRSRRGLATTVVLLAVVACGLFAAVGAGAASTTASPASHTLGDLEGSADVTAPDVSLEVTRVYHRTPSDPETVTVDYVITNPEVVQRPDVHEIRLNLSDVEYTRVDGLTEVSGDVYRLTATSGNATVTLTNRVSGGTSPAGQSTEWESDSYAQAVPLSLKDCDYETGLTNYNIQIKRCDEPQGVVVDADTAGSTTVGPAFTYVVDGRGFVTSGNSERVSYVDETNVDRTRYHPVVVMGDYETYVSTVDGRSFTLVVPAGVETRESPEAIVESVAAAADRLDVGYQRGDRYFLARPAHSSIQGFTEPTGAHWTVVNANQPVHTVRNTWTHEYVHTTDDTRTVSVSGDDSLLWFHEAYAEYRAQKTSLHNGYGSYAEYRTVLRHGMESQTEERIEYHDNYHTGPYVLATLDRKMRRASDGRNGTDELVQRLRTYDGRATQEDLVRLVAELSNQTVADFLRGAIVDSGDCTTCNYLAVDESEAPAPPTLSEYQSLYGPVPNVTTDVSATVVRPDRGNRTVSEEGPVAVRAGSTVRFTVRIRNDGGAPGHYEVRLRDSPEEPITGNPTVYDRAHGEVAPGETKTVTFSRPVGESGDTVSLDVGPIVPSDYVKYQGSYRAPYTATAVPRNATIVRENGTHEDPSHGAIVTGDTETIVFETGRTLDLARYAPGPQNVYVAGTSYTTGSDGVVAVTDLSIAPGNTTRVAFGPEGNRDVQYLSALESVTGSSVPNDVDGDGEYEDVDGDGDVDDDDVEAYFEHLEKPVMTDYVTAYDYNGNGRIDFDDVVELDAEA